jgi:hypothetical protein
VYFALATFHSSLSRWPLHIKKCPASSSPSSSRSLHTQTKHIAAAAADASYHVGHRCRSTGVLGRRRSAPGRPRGGGLVDVAVPQQQVPDGHHHGEAERQGRREQGGPPPARHLRVAARGRDAGLRLLRLLLPPGGLRRQAPPPVSRSLLVSLMVGMTMRSLITRANAWQVRERGVPVAPVRVGDGGDVGRGGEPVRAAERLERVRAVVPAVADGADGQVLHPAHQRQPAAARARTRRRLLQVAAAQGAGHRRNAAPPRARARCLARHGPRRAPAHPGPRQGGTYVCSVRFPPLSTYS